MSVLTALYNTYNKALEKGLVDAARDNDTVLLPVYHTNKVSDGSNIIEILIKESGEFISAHWLSKDSVIIFPVTESSIARAGAVIAPHPLCDELSYVSPRFDDKKYNAYLKGLNEWITFDSQDTSTATPVLQSIGRYVNKSNDIFYDVVNFLFASINHTINDKNEVIYTDEKGKRKVKSFEKTFVTYKVEVYEKTKQNQSVTNSKLLHNRYIEYMAEKISQGVEKFDVCDITGKKTYCSSRHRGLLGNAKLVSISNHIEAFFGRISDGKDVVRIGFEASQKIHLMIKFLLENKSNCQYLGDNCTLITWFSDDIINEEALNLADQFGTTYVDDPFSELEEDEEGKQQPVDTSQLGGSRATLLNRYLSGYVDEFDDNSMFYVMMISKISSGRISIKYFRALPKADIYQRVAKWYESTSWQFYDTKKNVIRLRTPSLKDYADFVFGLENSSGYLECKSDKLRTKTIERLLPCIIEGRRLPEDLVQRALSNLKKRLSYDKSWDHAVRVGCSIFKKYHLQNSTRKEVKILLDTKNVNRSYLHGRLLALFEKIEQEAMKELSSGGRTTNAERLWNSYIQTPGRTRLLLESKLRPYLERLKKNSYGLYRYYDSLLTKITDALARNPNFEAELNKPLDEYFVYGYYGQKQSFYTKRESNDTVEKP